MKNTIFILLLVVSLFNCSSDDDAVAPAQNNMAEETLIGRWSLVGFEENFLYEFTEDKRFDIYGIDGEFATVEEQMAEGLNGLDWWYEGDMVTVDLNFGNTSTLTPQFVCNNYVVKWIDAEELIHSIMFREGYDYSSCDE
jgi:hypothetical protein